MPTVANDIPATAILVLTFFIVNRICFISDIAAKALKYVADAGQR
jgi:hypothetical protein